MRTQVADIFDDIGTTNIIYVRGHSHAERKARVRACALLPHLVVASPAPHLTLHIVPQGGLAVTVISIVVMLIILYQDGVR